MPRPQRSDLLAVAAILAFGLWSLAPGLGHPTIFNWDEAFHQVVTRMTYEDPPIPAMYRDPLYPLNPAAWWESGVWLHKPPGTAWFGALMMHLTGVTPLALRFGSLVGMLAAALALHGLVKPRAGRWWALAGALGFLALPAGWTLAQGFHFGDVTDCTLVGWVAVSIWLLTVGVEKQDARWMAAAGAAVGLGFLCKSFLALVPVGVAGVLFGARVLKWCSGPSGKGLAAMYGAFAVVGLPWSVYATRRWPDLAKVNTAQALEFITAAPGSDVAMWRRPWDGILNEVNAWEARPLPTVAVVVAMVWLWRVAIREKDHRVAALAIWLTSTELIHSLMAAKSPAHLWNAFPAVLGGLALLGADLWRSPAAGPVTAGMLATPWLIDHVPALARGRLMLPGAVFFQTRTHPGLFEGGLAVGAAALLAWLAGPRLLEKRPLALRAIGSAAGAWLVWVLLVSASALRLETARDRLRAHGYDSATRDVGLALSEATPKRSVIWLANDIVPPEQFEHLNLMFWSGRMTYLRPADVALAKAKGYRSFIVAPRALPLKPVEGVPAAAWQRAYDAETPAPLPDLPEGVTKRSADAGPIEVLGVASEPAASGLDRWAIYARSKGGPPPELRVVFHLRSGEARPLVIPPEASLVNRDRFADGAWFILPAVGPPRGEVTELEFGTAGARVPLASPAP